jgi:hypothetical protein
MRVSEKTTLLGNLCVVITIATELDRFVIYGHGHSSRVLRW